MCAVPDSHSCTLRLDVKGGLPKVSGPNDRLQAARRGAAILGALGHPELEKIAAKEEQDKRKRKQRLLQLGRQHTAQHRRQSVGGGQE